MNKVKKDVRMYGIRPEMALVRSIVQSVFAKHGYYCTVTSGVREKKGKYSLHQFGFAEDYKTKHIPVYVHKRLIIEEVTAALPNCDVVFEHLGKAQEHLHVEFDDHDDALFQQHKAESKKTGIWPA